MHKYLQYFHLILILFFIVLHEFSWLNVVNKAGFFIAVSVQSHISHLFAGHRIFLLEWTSSWNHSISHSDVIQTTSDHESTNFTLSRSVATCSLCMVQI